MVRRTSTCTMLESLRSQTNGGKCGQLLHGHTDARIQRVFSHGQRMHVAAQRLSMSMVSFTFRTKSGTRLVEAREQYFFKCMTKGMAPLYPTHDTQRRISATETSVHSGTFQRSHQDLN